MATTPKVSDKALVKIELANQVEFSNFLNSCRAEAKDLRIPFGIIAKSLMKFERQIFQLRGKGRYVDLKESTKRAKEPNVYPILFRTGRLAHSLTNPGGENITRIGRQVMEFGTKVPYGVHHQFGTKKMAKRPFLFVDKQRLEQWKNILYTHLGKKFCRPRA